MSNCDAFLKKKNIDKYGYSSMENESTLLASEDISLANLGFRVIFQQSLTRNYLNL